MTNPIHILLIDDDVNYSLSLSTKSRTFGMKITAFTNFEEGLQELQNHPFKYRGLIFDARCLIKKNSHLVNDKSLSLGILGLQEIENNLNHIYPLAVNTGYVDVFVEEKDLIEKRRGKIFNKALAENSDDLFQFLQEKIHNSEEWKYADVFEVFDRAYLDNNFRSKLLYILQNVENTHEQQNVFAAIRVIQEEMYHKILLRHPVAVPPSNTFNKRNNYLSGNPQPPTYSPVRTVFQTSTIEHLANSIYRITSDYGSHLPQRPTNVPVIYWETPSVYAMKSLVFALMEQLLWFKSLMSSQT